MKCVGSVTRKSFSNRTAAAPDLTGPRRKTTVRRKMKSFTIKLPLVLKRKVAAAARRNGETSSALARRALAREAAPVGSSFAAMAARSKGMLKHGATDLSSREGYGPR